VGSGVGISEVSGGHVPVSCSDGRSGGDGRCRGWRLQHGDGRREGVRVRVLVV